MLADHFQAMYPNLNVDIDCELELLKVTVDVKKHIFSFYILNAVMLICL